MIFEQLTKNKTHWKNSAFQKEKENVIEKTCRSYFSETKGSSSLHSRAEQNKDNILIISGLTKGGSCFTDLISPPQEGKNQGSY